MKNFISALIVLISMVPKMFSQTSLDFTFNQNQISLSKNNSVTEDILVFKGQILEHQLSVATPILGKTFRKETQLQFTPLVPFDWSQNYTLVYNQTIDYFIIPIPEDYEFLSVTEIYPTSKSLPSNLLKWYIRFSKPINTTMIYDHIKFLNLSGETIPRAILPLENALISDDGTLLTIWIEPGRQKRGLIPNKQLGSVFSKEGTYKLIVSQRIKDNKGISMIEDFVHPFLITEADRIKPTINTWIVKPPKINSTSDLVIKCNESLDYGSSLDAIIIIDNNNSEVKGSWELLEHETVLIFRTKVSWKKGTYQIFFDASIEDLAGNNLDRLFDSKIKKNNQNQTSPKNYKLEFNVK